VHGRPERIPHTITAAPHAPEMSRAWVKDSQTPPLENTASKKAWVSSSLWTSSDGLRPTPNNISVKRPTICPAIGAAESGRFAAAAMSWAAAVVQPLAPSAWSLSSM